MKLTPAEDWNDNRWLSFEKGTSNVEFYRQIQADALRAIKSIVSQADDNCSGEQFKLWLVERLLIEANQLHPLPEVKPISESNQSKALRIGWTYHAPGDHTEDFWQSPDGEIYHNGLPNPIP